MTAAPSGRLSVRIGIRQARLLEHYDDRSTVSAIVMTQRDPRIDSYIARQAEFARPILGYVRERDDGLQRKRQ